MAMYAPEDAVLLSTLTLKRTWSAKTLDSRSIQSSSEMWADVVSKLCPPDSSRFEDELERVSSMTTDSLHLYYFATGVHTKVGLAATSGLVAVCLKALKAPDVLLSEDIFQAAGIDQGNAAICYLLFEIMDGDPRIQCLCLWAAFFIVPSTESFNMLKNMYTHPRVPQITKLDCWQHYNLIQCVKYFLPIDISLNKNWDYASAICVKYLRRCKLVCTRWQLPGSGVQTLRLYDKSWNPCFLDFVKILGVKRIRAICHTALKRCKRGTQLLSCTLETMRVLEVEGKSTVAGNLKVDPDELPQAERAGGSSMVENSPERAAATPVLESGGHAMAIVAVPGDGGQDEDVEMVSEEDAEGEKNNNEKNVVENCATPGAVTSGVKESGMEIDSSSDTDDFSVDETEREHQVQPNMLQSLSSEIDCANQAEASSSSTEREIGRKFRGKSTLDIPDSNIASTRIQYVHSTDLSNVASAREMDWLYFAVPEIQQENILECGLDTQDGDMTNSSTSDAGRPDSALTEAASEEVASGLNGRLETQSWEQEELSDLHQEGELTSVPREEGELEEIDVNGAGNLPNEWTVGSSQGDPPCLLIDNQAYDEEPLNLVQEKERDDSMGNEEEEINHALTDESNSYMTKENVMWNSPPPLEVDPGVTTDSTETDGDTLTNGKTIYIKEEEESEFVNDKSVLCDLNDRAATSDLGSEVGAAEPLELQGNSIVEKRDLDGENEEDTSRKSIIEGNGDPLSNSSSTELLNEGSPAEVNLQSEEKEIDITIDSPAASNGCENVTLVNQESVEHEEESSHKLGSVVTHTPAEEASSGTDVVNQLVGDEQSPVDGGNFMQLEPNDFTQEEPLNLVQGESLIVDTTSNQIEEHMAQTSAEEFNSEHSNEDDVGAGESKCTVKQSVTVVNVSSNMMRKAYMHSKQDEVEEWKIFVMDENGDSEVEDSAKIEGMNLDDEGQVLDSYVDEDTNKQLSSEVCTVQTTPPKKEFNGKPVSCNDLRDSVAQEGGIIKDQVLIEEVSGVVINWEDESPDRDMGGCKVEVVAKQEKEEESELSPDLELIVEEAEDEIFPVELTCHQDTFHERETSNVRNDIKKDLILGEGDDDDDGNVIIVNESDEPPSHHDTSQEMECVMHLDSHQSDIAKKTVDGRSDTGMESEGENDEVLVMSEPEEKSFLHDDSEEEDPFMMHLVSDRSVFVNSINTRSDIATEDHDSVKSLSLEQGDLKTSPRDTVTVHHKRSFQFGEKPIDNEDLFLKRDSLFGVTYSSNRALRSRPFISTRSSDNMYPVATKKDVKARVPVPPQPSERLNVTRSCTRASARPLPQHLSPDETCLRPSRNAHSERPTQRMLKSQRTSLKRSSKSFSSYERPEKFAPHCAKSLKRPTSPHCGASQKEAPVVWGSIKHSCRTQVEPLTQVGGATQAKSSLKCLTLPSQTSVSSTTKQHSPGTSVRQNSQQVRSTGANGVRTRQQRRGQKNANPR